MAGVEDAVETAIAALVEVQSSLKQHGNANGDTQREISQLKTALHDRTSELHAARQFITLLKKKLESHRRANEAWQEENKQLRHRLALLQKPKFPEFPDFSDQFPLPANDLVSEVHTSETELLPSQPLLQESMAINTLHTHNSIGPDSKSGSESDSDLESDPELGPDPEPDELASEVTSQPRSQPVPSTSTEPREAKEPKELKEPKRSNSELELEEIISKDWHPQDFIHNEKFNKNTYDYMKAARIKSLIEERLKITAQHHDTPPGFWVSGFRFAPNTQEEQRITTLSRNEDAMYRLVEALTPGGRYLFRHPVKRDHSAQS